MDTLIIVVLAPSVMIVTCGIAVCIIYNMLNKWI